MINLTEWEKLPTAPADDCDVANMERVNAELRARIAELEAELNESKERVWTRMGNTQDPLNPGFFVCNFIPFDSWEALRRTLFNEPADQ